MSKHLSIIAFDHTDWHSPWMNRQQVLSRLGARGWHVVYSRGRLPIWERRSADFRRAPLLPEFEQCDGVTIDHSGKLLVSVPRLQALDAALLKCHARRLRTRALARGGKLAVLVYHPVFQPYVDLIRPDYLIFYLRDAYHAEPGWGTENKARFERLVAAADLIVASRMEMAALIPEERKPGVLELPNGVDFEAFKAAAGGPEPADIAAIPHPRLGYIGRINRKVDFGLILALARQRPDWHFVLVGPVASLGGAEKEEQWRALQALGNVHCLGNKPVEALPPYMAAMDVHLLAYDMVAAPWTAYGSPLKLYECLAAGRPVISAPLDTMEAVEDIVRLAAAPAEWARAIEQALAAAGPELTARCQALAARNGWDGRVDRLEARLAALRPRPGEAG